jgi:hypothetical protein
MANTYSSNLRLIIQQDGTNQGTWGGYTNTNIASLIEQAITGVGAITVSGSSNYTLTVTNGASDEARNAVLNITGTLTAAINVICPTAAKTYIVKNGTTGGFAITLKTSAGTGISVPNGATAYLYCDGTNVVEGVNYATNYTAGNLAYTGTLTGGTGVINIGSGQLYKDANGNVGIGTSSPGTYGKLEVQTNGGTGVAIAAYSPSTSNGSKLRLFDNYNYAGIEGVPVAASASTDLSFIAGGSSKMRLDSSGNLGLGVTPSAWGSPVKNLDINTTGGFGSYSNGTGSQQVWQTNNAYLNSSLAWTYKYTGVGAFMYNQDAGHKWYTAPFGTAGNEISFTQAMTLDANGHLLVGTTTVPTVDTALALTRGTTTSWMVGPSTTNGNGANFFIINSAYDGVYLASGTGAWSSNSDERLKTDLKPIENAAQKVSTLRAVTGRFKTDEEGVSRSFLIAQDIQAVLPEAVNVQTDEMGTLGVQYTDTIPLLVAAIKELTARLETLEGKIK